MQALAGQDANAGFAYVLELRGWAGAIAPRLREAWVAVANPP